MKLSLTTLFSVLLVSLYASSSITVVVATPAPAVPCSSDCYKCPAFDNNSPTKRPLSSQTTIAGGTKYHCVYNGAGPGQHTCDYSVTTGAGVPGNNGDCPNNAATTPCNTKHTRRRRGRRPGMKHGDVKKAPTVVEAMDRIVGTNN